MTYTLSFCNRFRNKFKINLFSSFSSETFHYRINLKDFYLKEKTNYPRNFILGYITHILTDIIFDESFYLDITDKMLNDNISNEETHNLMRKDMENYASNSKYKNISFYLF